MHRGYIKLWRKSLETSIWFNSDTWRFWCYCLLKASYSEREQTVGNQEVRLKPGDFVFGRFKASEETGLSERKIRTALDTLRKRQNVTIKTTNKYSIISIVNWEEYQEEATSTSTNKRPATDQQMSTDKKVNNSKNGKKFIEPTIGDSKDIKHLQKTLSKAKGFALPDWIDAEAWNGFVVMRKKIKKPLTEHAMTLAIKELEKLKTVGNDPNAVLNKSTLHSWQGLFEIKRGDYGRQPIRPNQGQTGASALATGRYTPPD